MSVYGTGAHTICLADFLGSLLTFSIHLAEAAWYYWVSANSADLPTEPIPTPFNARFRQGAEFSLLLLSIARYASMGILTHCPSTTPFGFALGPDLPAVD